MIQMGNRKLSEKWIKASIIGTIWAASEIVLGSFLHNLRVPLSSNFLTGIDHHDLDKLQMERAGFVL